MGLIFGCIKKLIKWCIYFALFVALIVLIPNLPPYSTFSSIELEPSQPREGPLAPNGALNNAQKMYHEKLLGPEAFQLYNGEVYTSLATGEIVKLSPGGHVTFVTKIGQPCTGLSDEPKCGRPLDFEFDEKEKKLIVADAYYGIWKVDMKTDKKQLLVSPRVEIEGRAPRLFNGIALYKNGDFFWTDSCEFQLQDGAYCMLTDPSGRLLHYNAAKNSSTVLVNNLWFANGLAVSPDGQFVAVAESAAYRLVKHYIDGPKKGRTEPFVTGLPGVPDNVRPLPDGSGLLVGLYVVSDDEHPLVTRSMARAPLARKFLARVMRLVEAPFIFLNDHFPHFLLQNVVHYVGNFKSMKAVSPPLSGLLQVDWNGNIVASYYNTDKTLVSLSDAIVYKDKLYTGAPHLQDFVGSVPAPESLRRAFASQQKTSPPVVEIKKEAPKTKEAPKKVQEPPKPVETKPKVEAKPTTAKPTQQPPKATSQPPKTTTPPPKTTTPPPKTTTPPPKATTQPPKATPPPPKATTPTPKATTPPPKTTTPPPKTTTPPPKTTTPQPKAATPPPKQADKQATVPPKTAPPTKPMPAESKSVPTKSEDKKKPNQIPVQEDIPVDTAKPNKEPLKVIKKDGPTEIPNHL